MSDKIPDYIENNRELAYLHNYSSNDYTLGSAGKEAVSAKEFIASMNSQSDIQYYRPPNFGSYTSTYTGKSDFVLKARGILCYVYMLSGIFVFLCGIFILWASFGTSERIFYIWLIIASVCILLGTYGVGVGYLKRNKRDEIKEKNQSYQNYGAKTAKQKNPVISLILSLIICGLGQIYNGHWIKGIGLLIIMIVLWMIFWPLGVLVWIFGMYDAYTIAQKINKGEDPKDIFYFI